MRNRGRRSAASLTVVPGTLAPPGGPPAPSHLPGHVRAVWAEVVGSRPPDYFDAGTHGTLTTYCTALAEHRRLAAMLGDLDPAGDLDRYAKLTRVLDTHALRIGAAGTKLRLTVQATTDSRVAGRAAGRPGRPDPQSMVDRYRRGEG